MYVDSIDFLEKAQQILKELEGVTEPKPMTDADAARRVRINDALNYDPSADLATMSEEDLERRKRLIEGQLRDLRMPLGDHKRNAVFYKRLSAEVPETIRAMQKHLKKLQAHYDALIADEEKLAKAADAYDAELCKRIEAVDAETRGRQPVTFAEVQELLKQAREGKA